MVNPVGEIVLSGNLLLAMPIALAAGFLAFASPCVLPLVPGYLAYVGGFTRPVENARERSRLLLGVSLFILGFSVVFVAFSIVFATAGLLLQSQLDLITRVAGVIVILMGLVFVGQVSFLQRTVRPKLTAAAGLGGAPVLGIVFGLGWVPCIGPTLIAVNALVINEGDIGRAALIGLLYCVGLGVPFLLLAFGFRWATGAAAWLKRNVRVINLIGGGLLIVIGIAMVTGLWSLFVSSLGSVIGGTVTPL